MRCFPPIKSLKRSFSLLILAANAAALGTLTAPHTSQGNDDHLVAVRERTNDQSLSEAISAVKQVGPVGLGHRAAQDALQTIRDSGAVGTLAVLEAMRGASPVAKNWLRVAAADLADDAPLPREQLTDFFADLEQDPDARYLVFRWLTADDVELRDSILDKSTNDPSLPLRFLANKKLIEMAEDKAAAAPQEAVAMYERALQDARNPEQLQKVADALGKLGRPVDLADELGMFQRWLVIGPFDSTGGAGFDTIHTVEQDLLASNAASNNHKKAEPGKKDSVTWQNAVTTDALGSLDLNPIFANEKDAAVYAFCRFTTDSQGTFEGRLGSINANKLWINGELVTANEVYHAGSRIDQYIGSCQVKAGENWVLVKICQNNQTESWAQDWQFQFRITDAMGKPVNCRITLPAE